MKGMYTSTLLFLPFLQLPIYHQSKAPYGLCKWTRSFEYSNLLIVGFDYKGGIIFDDPNVFNSRLSIFTNLIVNVRWCLIISFIAFTANLLGVLTTIPFIAFTINLLGVLTTSLWYQHIKFPKRKRRP